MRVKPRENLTKWEHGRIDQIPCLSQTKEFPCRPAIVAVCLHKVLYRVIATVKREALSTLRYTTQRREKS